VVLLPPSCTLTAMTLASVRVGNRAPDFKLPAVNSPDVVSLADFRSKSAVLLGLYRGLHCPFCRRQLVQLSSIHGALATLGTTPVAVVNTPRERAEVYFRYHASPIVVLADPDARTHRAFGVPSVTIDDAFAQARINPTGELPAPLQPMEANAALNAKEGFEMTKVDEEIFARHGAQLAGHFLIDRDGIVRWTTIEAEGGVGDIGRFPSPMEMLATARRVL
jgi:peroxiredoxin